MPGTEARLLENEYIFSSHCTPKRILVSVIGTTLCWKLWGGSYALHHSVNKFAEWDSLSQLHPQQYCDASEWRAKLNLKTLQDTAPIASPNLAATSISHA